MKKIVKLCLHSSNTVQNSFHFDEIFFIEFFQYNLNFRAKIAKITILDLHDGMSTSDEKTPKGIPFLSERSKRRVEVAYQAIDDDHADQIAQVGERAFEEILREVSLI